LAIWGGQPIHEVRHVIENDVDITRAVQLRLLEIVRYIDEMCHKHDIQYFLIGGSALGAVRHEGFIPWDDDFDIGMTWENYSRFIAICERELDQDRFYLQKERSEYWPMYYSKIRLNNTVFREEDSMSGGHEGLFVDIFCLESIADGKLESAWQYFCSKVLVAQSLSERGYNTASKKKKLAMFLSRFLAFEPVKSFLIREVRRHNPKQTTRVSPLFGVIRYRKAFFPREYFGDGQRLKFENLMLPVPSRTHEYLTLYFGDYLTPPPPEKRKGHDPKMIRL